MRVFQVVALLSVFLWGSSASTEELSQESKALIQKSISVRVSLPDRVCKQPMDSISKSQALRVRKDLKWEGAPKFTELIAAVPPAEKKLPKVKKALLKAHAFLDCLTHIETSLKALEDYQNLYVGFMNAVEDADQTARALQQFADHPTTPLWTHDPKQLQKWKTDLEMMHGLCTGKFKGVNNFRCQIAANRKAIIERLAKNFMAKQVSLILENFEKEIEKFEQHRGYLRLDANAEIKAFYHPKEMKKEMGKRIDAVLAVAGISADNAWTEFDKVHAQLWGKVRESGKTWKAPKREGKQRAAVKAAKKRFKQHKVSRAYMTRSSWLLHKNSRGKVIERTKVGYVIYKVKSDKAFAGSLCRAQSFTYSEKKVRGKFKKSSEISELGFVRYESCK